MCNPCYDAADLFCEKVAMSAEIFAIWQAPWQSTTEFNLTKTQRDWLLETNSLTARLKALPGEFSLAVQCELQQQFPLPVAQMLGAADGALQGMVREVLLKVDDVPCIYAQSWLPQSTLAALKPLAELGQKPLGEFIFQQPALQRGPIELAKFPQSLALGQWALAADVFGRRSVFALNGQQLLVQELFLPGLFELCSGT